MKWSSIGGAPCGLTMSLSPIKGKRGSFQDGGRREKGGHYISGSSWRVKKGCKTHDTTSSMK